MPRHLIHVGFPKAGATFFKAWCAAHPEIAWAPGGVSGYGSTEDLIVRSAKREALPPTVVTSDEGFVGAPRLWAQVWQQAVLSPDDLQRTAHEVAGWLPTVRENVAETLHALFPEAHVLVLTRGFRSSIPSMYSQYLKLGGTLSFRGFALGDPEAERPTPAFAEAWRTYLDLGAVVELYEGLFGADRVTVVPYELLRNDRAAFVAELAAAAGVEPLPFDPGRVNPSLTPRALSLLPAVSRTVLGASVALPGPVGGRLRGWYGRSIMSGRRLKGVLDRVPVDASRDDFRTPPALLAELRGLAGPLLHRPSHAPYRSEYLVDDVPTALPQRDAPGP